MDTTTIVNLMDQLHDALKHPLPYDQVLSFTAWGKIIPCEEFIL
ncbi:hypothetical protein [Parapedobacter tibetensis]|nr:hypothetical protein [Parapedobacter tibetensis]